MKNFEADRPISIWQPQEVDGLAAFVRPEPYPLGDHFSDRRVIYKEKTSGIRRICFFGESVAAGYGYAPGLTPAKVLDQQLRHVCGNQDYEIVDLARTNETIAGLTHSIESAMQLKPDALVLFSGNNWTMLESPGVSVYAPEPEKRVAFGGMLRENGIYGPIGHAALEVLHKAGNAYDRIAEIAKTHSIPVILVIPEINLTDWENKQPVRWLPGDGTARWYALLDKAMHQLVDQKWKEAEETAWQMEDLDGCTCPTTYRVLAKSFVGQKAWSKAQMSYQAEVDVNHYASLCFLGAPQINTGGRTLQQRAAERHGFFTVDLREVFAIHTGNMLPGRRMFLDYCHLTIEGIKIAMAAVASELLNRMEHPKAGISWERLTNDLPEPEISEEANAAALLGMAMHTAHRQAALFDALEMPEYWCRLTLETSGGVKQAMSEVTQSRFSALPAVLTKGLRENTASEYRLTMQHGWKYEYLDASLVSAIESSSGSHFQDEMASFFKRLQDNKAIDLLNPPCYLWDPVERFFPEVMDFKDLNARVFYRSAWPQSSFVLPGKPMNDVGLQITHRLPGVPGWHGQRSGTVVVKLNGVQVDSYPSGEKWTVSQLKIPEALFKPGLNKLTICWPPLPACGDEALENILNRLEHGLEADLHPVFGEIFSIKVLAG